MCSVLQAPVSPARVSPRSHFVSRLHERHLCRLPASLPTHKLGGTLATSILRSPSGERLLSNRLQERLHAPVKTVPGRHACEENVQRRHCHWSRLSGPRSFAVNFDGVTLLVRCTYIYICICIYIYIYIYIHSVSLYVYILLLALFKMRYDGGRARLTINSPTINILHWSRQI
jgi:hypothetical protein